MSGVNSEREITDSSRYTPTDASHRHLALAGAQALHGEPGHVLSHVFEGLGAPVAQDIVGRRRHRERNVVQERLALEGGDRDLYRHPGDRESEIDGQRRAGFKPEVASGLLDEARERCGHGVDAGGQALGVAAVA
jgi:hypothetical protein